ncbi:MAG TPA: hypothetical protein VF228_00870 [Iamia sp.]
MARWGAMTRRTAAVVALVVLAGGAGCGGDATDGKSSATTVADTTTTSAPLDEVLAGDVPAAACASDARTLETAAEAYLALEGTYPASAADLVGGFLDEAPRYHELRIVSPTEAEAVPVPGAGCD